MLHLLSATLACIRRMSTLCSFGCLKHHVTPPILVTSHTYAYEHVWSTQVGDSQSALQRFDEMRLAGLQPTQRCMTSLLAACARARDLTAAHRVFRGMGTAGNVPAYTALMDACLKEGSPAACAEAFQVQSSPTLPHMM